MPRHDRIRESHHDSIRAERRYRNTGEGHSGDTAFVEGLYRELLGRPSDPKGMRDHLRGLAQGMTRQQIREVFLHSPERQGRLEAMAGGAALPGPDTPSAPDFQGQLRQLIAKDIQFAYGREATQRDFDYWLPKLAADPYNLDYWHKRLLGWQAGGDDVAKNGPYAGGGGPRGHLSTVEEVVGAVNVPSTPFESHLKAIISADLALANRRTATNTDFAYWLPKMLADPNNLDYWHRRLLGWQAGGPDQAVAGPYAGGSEAHGRVPSIDEVLAQAAAAAPAQPAFRFQGTWG
jgi:hypothetical protein